MRKVSITVRAGSAAVLALAAAKASAQMVYEPFDYGTSSIGTNLANLTGSPSFAGYINPMNGQQWFDTNTSSTTTAGPETTIISGNLQSSGVATAIGNSAFMQELGGASGGTARLGIAPTGSITPSSLYWSMSFEITSSTDLTSGGSFVAAFNNTFGTQTSNPTVIAGALQVKLDADGSSYDIGIRNSTSFTYVTGMKFSVGQEVFLVGEYTDLNGASDNSKIWINPGSLGAATAPAANATVTAQGLNAGNSIASFILRTGNAAVPKGIEFDEIRIDPSWSQVTAPTGTTFSGTAGGNWSNSANWTAGSADAASAFAYFSGLASGAAVSVDTNETAGTLTINNANGVTISGPGILALNGGGGASGVNVIPVSNSSGAPTPASHTLSAGIAAFNPIEANVGQNQTLTVSGGITAQASSISITKNGAGTLVLQGNNTFDSGVQINDGILAVAGDSGLGAAPSAPTVNVTLNGAGTTLQFNGSAAFNANRTLSIGSAATSISTNNGNSDTWAGLITGNNLNKNGSGILTLSNSANTFAAMFVNNGVVNVSSDGALGTGAGTVQLQGGGLQLGASTSIAHAVTINASNGSIDTNGNSATFTGAIRGAGLLTKKGVGNLAVTNLVLSSAATAGLNISAGSVSVPQNGGDAIVVNSLTVGDNTSATTAQLDLNDNDMIVGYTGAASPINTVRTLLAAGFNAGTWTGNGITSSIAATNPAGNTGLGYGDAASLGISSVDGQSITGSAVVIKYTYFGDTNLDGQVTSADFSNFLNGFANGGSTWAQGDFTYDGHVDLGNDFNLFLIGYLSQGNSLGALAPIIQADVDLSTAQKATLLSVVPEPSTAALAALAAMGLVSRRRRRIR